MVLLLMLGGSDKRDVHIAYAQSFKTIMVVLCALAGVSLVPPDFIKSDDLKQTLETEQGLIQDKETSRTNARKKAVTRKRSCDEAAASSSSIFQPSHRSSLG
jgi:hypothetical protein